MQKAVNGRNADDQIRIGHMCLTVTNYYGGLNRKSKQEIASSLEDIFRKQNLINNLQEQKSSG